MSPNQDCNQIENFPRHEDGLLDGFLTKPQLAKTLGVSERTIDRWVNLRQFPKPAKIGRLILWREDAVRAHLSRLADIGDLGASTAPRSGSRGRR